MSDTFNAAAYFVDRNVERGRGSATAIECGERRLSYSDVLAAVNRFGNALRSLRVGIEQRVVLILPDGPEFIAAFFGAIKIGAVAVPVNTSLKAPDYRYVFEDSRACTLVVASSLWAAVEPALAGLRHLARVVVVDDANASVHADAAGIEVVSWAAACGGASEALDPEPTSGDDAAFWLYSSGTTGFPKGVVHLQHDMKACADTFGRTVLGIGTSDRTFSVSKLYFAYGLGNGCYFPFSVGATTLLYPPRFSPEAVLEYAAAAKPTLFFSVPTAYAAMLDVPDAAKRFPLTSVRMCVSAGEALPAELFRRWRDTFGVDIIDGIGSTEACHMFISNRPGDIRPGSTGKVVEGYHVRIVDATGMPVARGEIGRLQVSGDSIAAGYWNKREKTKSTFLGTWLDTGDSYSQDGDGYYWYAGRSDDMLKVAGMWVSPAEVEAALVEHDAVLEAALVGESDGDGLTKPVAYVVLRRGHAPTPELATLLRSFAHERLAGFKCPKECRFVDDLPKTATGKIQRFKLRTHALT